MDKQEVFDKVARHLLTQNARSTDETGERCRYRSSEGLRCAIGALLPNDYDTRDIEGRPVHHGGVVNALLESGIAIDGIEDEKLLFRLQSIHDETSVELWPLSLIMLAGVSRLSAAVVHELRAKARGTI